VLSLVVAAAAAAAVVAVDNDVANVGMSRVFTHQLRRKKEGTMDLQLSGSSSLPASASANECAELLCDS
jgi:hypothetical protein